MGVSGLGLVFGEIFQGRARSVVMYIRHSSDFTASVTRVGACLCVLEKGEYRRLNEEQLPNRGNHFETLIH